MKVLGLNNIVREEGVIYYRKCFTALCEIELPLRTINTPISFTVEMSPLGEKKIDITFLESIEYPLLPILKILKEMIKKLDYEGKLLWLLYKQNHKKKL